jgi:hypothetical protein
VFWCVGEREARAGNRLSNVEPVQPGGRQPADDHAECAWLLYGCVMKIIIRLLDDQKQLLGWAEVGGKFGGDRCLYADVMRAEIVIERVGIAHFTNIQWAELNINLTTEVTRTHVEVGQIWVMRFVAPLFQFGSSEESLPAVTEKRNVEIEVPTGHLGIVTH